MKKTAKLISFGSILCVFSIAMPLRIGAMGCSCGPAPLDDAMYGRLKMIIAGEIIETRKDHSFHPKVENLLLKIKVDRVWKEEAERMISLPLMNQVSDCAGMDVVLGRKYLFRVIKIGEGAAVLGVCGASGFLEYSADDMDYLSKKHYWIYIDQ